MAWSLALNAQAPDSGPADAIARLGERIASGAATLECRNGRGYLPSLLEHLDINIDSQVLVFSKTSFQHTQIDPRHPRAIYFNDSTATRARSSTPSIPGRRSNKRWGGWYVTGTHGSIKHMGNAVASHRDRPLDLDEVDTQNLTSVAGKLDVGRYLTGTSDIVALMTLEHQVGAVNRLGATASIYRTAERTDLVDPDAPPLAIAVDDLVDYMLSVDEAAMREPIKGVSTFTRTFAERPPRDTRGRSLREFDLSTRRNARVRVAPLLHVRVRDALIEGRGSGVVSLLSAFTVSAAGDRPEMNSGSLHRYLAEAVWYPSALLPSPTLRWTAIDPTRALATLTNSSVTVSLEFRFAETGEVTSIYTPGRWGAFSGGYRQIPWEGHFRDYRECQGVVVPTAGDVGWWVDNEWHAVWKGTIARYCATQ